MTLFVVQNLTEQDVYEGADVLDFRSLYETILLKAESLYQGFPETPEDRPESKKSPRFECLGSLALSILLDRKESFQSMLSKLFKTKTQRYFVSKAFWVTSTKVKKYG